MVNPPISVQPKDHSRIKLATSSIDIQWNIPSYPKYHLSYLIISHYSTRRVLCLFVELPTTNFHLSSVQHELRHPFDLFIGNPILDYDNPNIKPLFHQIHQGQPGSTRVSWQLVLWFPLGSGKQKSSPKRFHHGETRHHGDNPPTRSTLLQLAGVFLTFNAGLETCCGTEKP